MKYFSMIDLRNTGGFAVLLVNLKRYKLLYLK